MTKREELDLRLVNVARMCADDCDNHYTYLVRLCHRKDLRLYMIWKNFHLLWKDSALYCSEVMNDTPYAEEIIFKIWKKNTPQRLAKEIKLLQKSIK